MTYTKEQQLFKRRIKPTQKQMGAISAAVDRKVKERSNGVCERCGQARATERAHLIRRTQLTHKTTDKDIAHLCKLCHLWADSGSEGRKWLKEFQQQLAGE